MKLAIFEGYAVPGAGSGVRSTSRGSSRRRANQGSKTPTKEKHMARHRRRRHRRGFGDFLTVPGLGGLAKDLNPLGKSVQMNSVLIGAGLGMGGGALVRMGIGKAGIADKLPAFVATNIGPVSTILAGIGGYMFFKKKSPEKAKGVLYGAMLAGLVPVGWNVLQTQFPQYFADYVSIPGLGDVVERPMGMLVESPSPALHGIAAIHDSDEAF